MAYPDGCSPISWEPTSLPSLAPGRPLRVGAVLNAGSHVERFALAVQRALGARGGEIEDLSFADHARRIEDGNFDLSIWLPISGRTATW
jgi:hypothetical protein